jgi:toxin ParE1/3/4
MKVTFSPKAAFDLEQIGDYIAKDSPARAVTFIEDIERHCFKIAEMPEAYPARDDLKAGLKMALHGNYLILFSIEQKVIRIERIIHGARRISDLI